MRLTSGQDLIKRLYQLTLKEREAAKSLDIELIEDLTKEKQEIVSVLEDIDFDLDVQTKELLKSLQKENRRNAYFFASALEWIQDSLNFLEGRISWSSYSDNGEQVHNQQGGSLLSGRV